MKGLFAAACVMWTALAMEMAWPGQLAQGSLLLPFACGVMYWTRSASGLIFSGLVLLLDWVARPTQLPMCPMLLPIISVVVLAPSIHGQDHRAPGLSFRIPAPLHLPLLTLAAVLLQIAGTLPMRMFATPSLVSSAVVDSLKSLAIIALPVSAGVSLMIRLADELGLRRSTV